MLPIRNISYLSSMFFNFWEKCINSHKIGQRCSTPLISTFKLILKCQSNYATINVNIPNECLSDVGLYTIFALYRSGRLGAFTAKSGRKQWRNRRGGGGAGGQSAPQRLLTGKFLLTYREKRGKEKMEKGWELRRKGGKL